jgi:transcriptional regulator with XRE-family HTH domain
MQKSLAMALRDARERSGLSQTAASRRAGLALGQLSKIESGASPSPEFATVARLCGVIGVSLDAIAADCGFVPARAATKASALLRRLTIVNEHLEGALRSESDFAKRLAAALSEVQAELVELTPTKRKRKPRK